jgi:DNA-binding protein YbaB
MLDKLKQLGQLKAMQDQMKKEKFIVEKEGIKIVVNGSLQVEELVITGDISPERIAQLVKDAVNEAMKKAQMGLAQKMAGMGFGF